MAMPGNQGNLFRPYDVVANCMCLHGASSVISQFEVRALAGAQVSLFGRLFLRARYEKGPP